MNNEQLAEFHGVNLRQTYRWTHEVKRKKTIHAQADVTPAEWRLVGEIMQLAYLYNAKGWVGEVTTSYVLVNMDSFGLTLWFNNNMQLKAKFEDSDGLAQLELIKRQLEQLVY